jgi:hypothetical protein
MQDFYCLSWNLFLGGTGAPRQEEYSKRDVAVKNTVKEMWP